MGNVLACKFNPLSFGGCVGGQLRLPNIEKFTHVTYLCGGIKCKVFLFSHTCEKVPETCLCLLGQQTMSDLVGRK